MKFLRHWISFLMNSNDRFNSLLYLKLLNWTRNYNVANKNSFIVRLQLKVRPNLISWSRSFRARTRKPYVARWENMHKFFSLDDVSFLQRFLLWRCLQFSHKILSECIYFSLKVHIGAIGREAKKVAYWKLMHRFPL